MQIRIIMPRYEPNNNILLCDYDQDQLSLAVMVYHRVCDVCVLELYIHRINTDSPECD